MFGCVGDGLRPGLSVWLKNKDSGAETAERRQQSKGMKY